MKLKLAILPLCLMALHAFGFEGTVKQSVTNFNGSGSSATMTWYIGAGSCRIDMSISDKDLKTNNTVMLMNPSDQSMIMYETSGGGEKVYFQMNASAVSGDAMNVMVNKTTETKKIGGYNCEKWTVMNTSGSYDVWITRDIDFNAAAYKEFFKGSMEIQALAQQGVKGFPMLTETRNGANASVTNKVTPGTLPAGTLSVPAEYKLYNAQVSPNVAAPKK